MRKTHGSRALFGDQPGTRLIYRVFYKAPIASEYTIPFELRLRLCNQITDGMPYCIRARRRAQERRKR